MTSLYLWDDERARSFEPFALTRPVGELRAGAALIRHRWERALAMPAAGFVAAEHLAHFEEGGAPPSAAVVPAGAVLANSRCVPSLAGAALTAGDRWSCGGRVAAVRLARSLTAGDIAAVESLDELASPGAAATELDGRWLDAVWDLIATLPVQLAEDVPAIADTLECSAPADSGVLGAHAVHVERGATVEPYVCFDATAGPILVRRGATVASFTRLVGPCVVGEGAMILGGRVGTSAIGERCKVHGEVSATVFLGMGNKGHDGFVGHSYVGRWANLGAGTITSNMKNTYGTVQLWTPAGLRDTGMPFLGTLFGDHVKTGIGLRLTTGTVLGAGANVVGASMPPKAVPPFAWGDSSPYDVYEIDRFLTVTERAMRRRDVALSAGMRRQLAAAHAARWRP